MIHDIATHPKKRNRKKKIPEQKHIVSLALPAPVYERLAAEAQTYDLSPGTYARYIIIRELGLLGLEER